MKLPEFARKFLLRRAKRMMAGREPDFYIGNKNNAYLRRWWVIPKNRLFNIYLHDFRRSDDSRALHDHPYANCSILLNGEYIEHVQCEIHGRIAWVRMLLRIPTRWVEKHRRGSGDIVFRSAKSAHRIELHQDIKAVYASLNDGGIELAYERSEIPVITLFITGPRIREWGFLCPQGWRHWRDYVAPGTGQGTSGSEIGKGCE